MKAKTKCVWTPLWIVLAWLMPQRFEWAVVNGRGRVVDDFGASLVGTRAYLKRLLEQPHLLAYYRQRSDGEVYLVLTRIRTLDEKIAGVGIWAQS